MAATEATIATPTLSLVLAAAVLVAVAYVTHSPLPAWLAAIPIAVVVLEGLIMLRYATRVAQTASQAVEEQRQRLAADDEVRHALAEAARKGEQE